MIHHGRVKAWSEINETRKAPDDEQCELTRGDSSQITVFMAEVRDGEDLKGMEVVVRDILRIVSFLAFPVVITGSPALS